MSHDIFVVTPSSCDITFITDGDDKHTIAPLQEAILLILETVYDMVVGGRLPVESDGTRADPLRFGHNFGNTLLTRTFRTLFPVSISESLSGWRVMSRGVPVTVTQSLVRLFPDTFTAHLLLDNSS
jgi:hypothetical protein